MKKAITLLAGILVITGCAKISSYSTNLDSKNFTEYFSLGEVTPYKSEKEFPGNFQMLAGVEGDDCQEKAHMAVADPAIARAKARRKAFQLGANAIVFSGCANVKTKQCVTSTICYGKAYLVEKSASE